MNDIKISISDDLYHFLNFYAERNSVDFNESVRRAMALLYLGESLKIRNQRLAIVSDSLEESGDIEFITGY